MSNNCKKLWNIVVNIINKDNSASNYIITNTDQPVFSNIKITSYPSSSKLINKQSVYLNSCNCTCQNIGTWQTCKQPQYLNMDISLVNQICPNNININTDDIYFVRSSSRNLILNQENDNTYTLPKTNVYINDDSSITECSITSSDDSEIHHIIGPNMKATLTSNQNVFEKTLTWTVYLQKLTVNNLQYYEINILRSYWWDIKPNGLNISVTVINSSIWKGEISDQNEEITFKDTYLPQYVTLAINLNKDDQLVHRVIHRVVFNDIQEQYWFSYDNRNYFSISLNLFDKIDNNYIYDIQINEQEYEYTGFLSLGNTINFDIINSSGMEGIITNIDRDAVLWYMQNDIFTDTKVNIQNNNKIIQYNYTVCPDVTFKLINLFDI